MNSKIIKFAIEAHDKVNHLYDGAPYSVHLAMVVGYAIKYIDCVAGDNESIISACWLHDTIEDCRLTYNDIKKVAGERVADLVFAVTNEKGKTRKDRANEKYYSDMKKVAFARFVKLCDRLANVKYSLDTGSSMFEVYKKENEDFVTALFSDQSQQMFFKEPLQELAKLLNN